MLHWPCESMMALLQATRLHRQSGLDTLGQTEGSSVEGALADGGDGIVRHKQAVKLLQRAGTVSYATSVIEMKLTSW